MTRKWLTQWRFFSIPDRSAASQCRYDLSGTQRDPVLSRVTENTKRGWPTVSKKELEPFQRRKDELTIQDGCLMWGSQVIIPPKHQAQLLAELHEGHLGIVKMKALARSYMWWPGMDKAIEEVAKGCTSCHSTHGSGRHDHGNA